MLRKCFKIFENFGSSSNLTLNLQYRAWKLDGHLLIVILFFSLDDRAKTLYGYIITGRLFGHNKLMLDYFLSHYMHFLEEK